MRRSQNRPVLVFPHRCVKGEEVERVGFPEVPGLSPWGDVSPEGDEPGLLGM
jgi:hypothetical protein